MEPFYNHRDSYFVNVYEVRYIGFREEESRRKRIIIEIGFVDGKKDTLNLDGLEELTEFIKGVNTVMLKWKRFAGKEDRDVN